MAHLDLSLDLEQLIHSDTLPAKSIKDAQALYDRLQAPVRVVLTGGLEANKIGLLEALLNQKLPNLPAASLHVRHGARMRASYQYQSGETILRDTMRLPETVSGGPPVARVDVTLPSASLQDIAFCLPSPSEDQALRLSDHSASLAQQADMVLWCTDAFAGVEETQWRSLPNALKDHSFLVYLASLRPLLRSRLKRLRSIGQSEFYRLDTVDLRRPHETGAAPLMAELLELARRGKAAEADNAALFVEAHRSHIAPPPPPRSNAETAVDGSAHRPSTVPISDGQAALRILYGEALDLVRSRAQGLVDPMPSSSDEDTARVLQICADTAESVAALFDAHSDPDPAYCFVKEEVLSTADRLLLMSMEQGLSPAIDAATTLLQMRRDFDFQIAAISTSSFTRSKAISPIDQAMHA